MADPTTAAEAIQKLGVELAEAMRRVARATVSHEEAKAALDAARSELSAAEHYRDTIRNRLATIADNEARGQPFDALSDMPF